MKRITPLLALLALTGCGQSWTNPIITDIYTADPSARVFGNTLYIYPSHDKDNAFTFNMEDYYVFSTRDMKTFTNCGLAFDAIRQTEWAHAQAWAPDCIERNGKYYLYYPTDRRHIGVAVSDSPTGPFHDALGHPLLSIDSPGVVCNRDFIDPCVFIDDDGQAYLYVGQNTVCCVKLNEDMISYEGEAFVIEGCDEFFEAIWMHKRKGKYYLSYSNGNWNGEQPQIAYAMSDSPTGPFEYKGIILDPVSSGTNHHSIVRFKGKWYIFYHNADLSTSRTPEAGRFNTVRRSVCVDRLYYNPDGTIKKVVMTSGLQ
ncbi:MAG: family 43 glycosylhydrolase [Bacteroidales bacterium]|nr:family 43 glycosylhydrolase [Bacteroidales bacterium]